MRAQNLERFVQLAEGVDEATWRWHLEHGDYSRWIREVIKDPGLADAAEGIERSGASDDETRQRMRSVIEERYTKTA